VSERDRQARTAALLLLIQHRKALQAQAWDGQPAKHGACMQHQHCMTQHHDLPSQHAI